MTGLQFQFGASLRRLRKQRGLTQSQLAEAVGRSTDLVSRIERGDSAPSFETIEKLSTVLNVSPATLFGGAQSQVPDSDRSEIDRLLANMKPAELRWLVDLAKIAGAKPR